jgi:hypothetical protein
LSFNFFFFFFLFFFFFFFSFLSPKVLSSGSEAKLVVNVHQTSLEDDHGGAPTKVVTKEGKEGSFGFTTEKQGEFRFCFHNEASGVDHELEVEFNLKV